MKKHYFLQDRLVYMGAPGAPQGPERQPVSPPAAPPATPPTPEQKAQSENLKNRLRAIKLHTEAPLSSVGERGRADEGATSAGKGSEVKGPGEPGKPEISPAAPVTAPAEKKMEAASKIVLPEVELRKEASPEDIYAGLEVEGAKTTASLKGGVKTEVKTGGATPELVRQPPSVEPGLKLSKQAPVKPGDLRTAAPAAEKVAAVTPAKPAEKPALTPEEAKQAEFNKRAAATAAELESTTPEWVTKSGEKTGAKIAELTPKQKAASEAAVSHMMEDVPKFKAPTPEEEKTAMRKAMRKAMGVEEPAAPGVTPEERVAAKKE